MVSVLYVSDKGEDGNKAATTTGSSTTPAASASTTTTEASKPAADLASKLKS